MLWFVGAHGHPSGLILEADKQSGKPDCLARCLNTAFVGVLHQGSTSGPPHLEHWAEQITVLYPLPLGFMFPSMKSTLAFLSLRLIHPWDFPGKSTGVGCHCLSMYQQMDLVDI